jgi:hypothetical protein
MFVLIEDEQSVEYYIIICVEQRLQASELFNNAQKAFFPIFLINSFHMIQADDNIYVRRSRLINTLYFQAEPIVPKCAMLYITFLRPVSLNSTQINMQLLVLYMTLHSEV